MKKSMYIKEVRIKVLQRDIAHGKPHDLYNCPVALATRRARIMPLSEVCVTGGSLDWSCNYLYPECVKDFIKKFDTGKLVNPISFYVVKGDF